MCIKKSEILELNNIIQHLNAIEDDKEIEIYLQDAVEDVELFISTLRSVNKRKLVKSKKKKVICVKMGKYTSDAVAKIFETNDLDEIIGKYTKQKLVGMYMAIYSSKPLSSYDKNRIAQSIYHHFHTIKRAKDLLG